MRHSIHARPILRLLPGNENTDNFDAFDGELREDNIFATPTDFMRDVLIHIGAIYPR
ncbi:uncharacterized protein PHACADRAFT_258622 [Phanerochaete carnosa HHB-10118-sp]|uniref:Uncharacterized protein n=1 Tax=Phanerochaete carnosa (strain HHB-10118-sp) TaxID=650164 RepID=K5UX16_PHACS|nr:uncharacterized protein PHACADRAFT_258622 [Phanerochaete carnosa HHB-10118-sp]EKM54631.1 hypothetical protein PHACADRAFT_258622 [Phanerochaete carnosa HHB-10118-sp]